MSKKSNYRRKYASDSDDEEKSEGSEISRATSSKSKVASADRFSRRMSYVPPRMRRSSVSKKSAQMQMEKANHSAVSRKSVKNFDDKKYRSNSHLTPVDW